jgi:hypothetical protein
MPSAFSRRRVSADLDVLSEGSDIIDKQRQSPATSQSRTLAGSQTTFTKGDPTKQTIVNCCIAGESAVTILFGLPGGGGLVANAVTAPPQAYALITWLVDGVPSQRLISIASGTSITGVGEYVSVQAWDSSVPFNGDPNPDYPISCIVAPGTRGSTSLPPTWFPQPATFEVLASGLGPVINIPQNVGIRSVRLLSSLKSDLVTLNFLDFTLAEFMFIPTDVLGNEYVDLPVPHRGGTCGVVVSNADTTNMFASLAFGVDG